MPVTHRAKRLWFYLNKPVKPSKHTAFTPIQRRARSIMSVASLFIFFAGGWWLLIALCSWEIAYLPSTSDGLAARALLEHWHLLPMELLNAHLIALAWLLGFSATVAPLVFLRRLGKTLYLQAPLSFAVSRRFRWLGHALGASIILRFTAGWLAASQLAEYQINFGSGFWATLTAAMVAYVVADLVRDGAQAAEENREFV
ncbi:MAG: hypothetical protein ABI767_10725 [Rhodanobacter sp.]